MMKVLISALFLALSTAALAVDKDHRELASASYSLADTSEYLANQAYYLREPSIAYSAEDLHEEASDVYHLARRGYSEHDYYVQSAFAQVEYTFENLERYFHNSAVKDHRLDQYWHRVQNSYRQLCYLMVSPLKDHRCD